MEIRREGEHALNIDATKKTNNLAERPERNRQGGGKTWGRYVHQTQRREIKGEKKNKKKTTLHFQLSAKSVDSHGSSNQKVNEKMGKKALWDDSGLAETKGSGPIGGPATGQSKTSSFHM